MGHNFINKGFDNGYSGLFDLGLDYNILNRNALGIGIVFNASVLRLPQTDVDLMILSPKIKVEYEIDLNEVSVIPLVGIGYSNWGFRSPEVTFIDDFGNTVLREERRQNENGLTIKGATKLVINDDKRIKWYFNLSYEFTKLERNELERGNIKFNRNIHLFYPGIGIAWHFAD